MSNEKINPMNVGAGDYLNYLYEIIMRSLVMIPFGATVEIPCEQTFRCSACKSQTLGINRHVLAVA